MAPHLLVRFSAPYGLWLQTKNKTGGSFPLILNPLGGAVGIGTTSPTAALHVLSTSSTTNIFENTGNTDSYLYLKNSTSGAYIGSRGNDISFSPSNGVFEAARIDSSGRLLIGTSTTSSENCTLQVRNNTGTSAEFFASSADEVGPYVLLTKSRGTEASPAEVSNGDGLGTFAFLGYDGSTYRTAARIAAECDGTWTDGGDTTDNPGRLVFSVTADAAASPTERMRITSSGAITCGPQVSGSDLVGTEACGFVADGVYAPVYKVKSSLTSNKYAALFFNGNGQVGDILMSGSSTAYNTSSDYRLKENVVPVPDGITRLLQLKPSRFNFKADPDNTVDGFLAHEAQAVVPECVTGEKDAVDDDGNPVYQGIDQSKLVPLLTAALQEAVAEIKALKDRVTALESA